VREWFHTQGTAATGASTQQHKPEEESLVRSKMSDIVARLPGVSTPVFAPWFVLRTSCRAWLRFLPGVKESSHATFAAIHWIIEQPTLRTLTTMHASPREACWFEWWRLGPSSTEFALSRGHTRTLSTLRCPLVPATLLRLSAQLQSGVTRAHRFALTTSGHRTEAGEWPVHCWPGLAPRSVSKFDWIGRI